MKPTINIILVILSATLIAVDLMGQHAPAGDKYQLFVGTYTKRGSEGIYVYEFDATTGSATRVSMADDIVNPSYLTLSPTGDRLYAVSEKSDGEVVAYSLSNKGSLEELQALPVNGADPCYIDISSDGRFLVTANYTGGNVSVVALAGDSGKPKALTDLVAHTGSGPNKSRQSEPHPHFAKVIGASQIWVADLGIDKIITYQLTKAGKLQQIGQGVLQPGSGPRHIAFHQGKSRAYVISELSNTITVFNTQGDLQPIQTISTLPDSFSGDSYCADIHLSPDGRFLYASNRGHDSVVCFKITAKGTLKHRQTISCGGNWPRNFCIDPTGRFLLVANQESDNIVVFQRNNRTGRLTKLDKDIKVSMPVCLVMKKK